MREITVHDKLSNYELGWYKKKHVIQPLTKSLSYLHTLSWHDKNSSLTATRTVFMVIK